MNLPLDTHAFLWFVADDPQLSPAALSAIRLGANRKYVSAASCWEIAIKVSIGKLRLAQPSLQFITEQLERNGFEPLPISVEDAAGVETLSFHHRNPFDRLLIAQALRGGMSLVSADTHLDPYGAIRIW